MNALDFVFTPHNYLPSNFPFPFTIPATSTLADVASDVITVTTSIATIPEKTVLPTPETLPSFNTSSPLGFLLYVAAQSQRILVGGSTSGGLFGGPTRSYWMLTLFMVEHIIRMLTCVVCSSQSNYDLRLCPTTYQIKIRSTALPPRNSYSLPSPLRNAYSLLSSLSGTK